MSYLLFFLIIGFVSVLFLVKTFIGSIVLGLIDILAGFAVIGIPASASFVPQTASLYLGALLITKGVYSIVSSLRI